MKTKFTKGKWFACCQKTNPHFLFTENGDTVICSFTKEQSMGEDLTEDEFKAHALLISKAPEMFEMLLGMLTETDDLVHSEIKKDIQQLLKEATEI